MPIELNTPDELKYQFYPTQGACFTFKVRAPNDAHLCLTPQPAEGEPMYEVFIGGWSNAKSVIRKDGKKPDVVEVETPGILNAGEFRGFWIRWYDNTITVGREGEAAAFMSYDAPDLFPVAFVGVCTGWGANGTWLLDDTCSAAPPVALGFSAPPASGDPGTWVPAANGEVPPNALEGGIDGSEQLYIARARFEGALIPGKLVPSHGCVYIPWGGAENPVTEYEVLCGSSGTWISVSGDAVPPNCLPAGESETGEPLFIGRASHDGTITVGKVQASHGVCYIPYGGQELAYSDYEVYVTQ